MTYHINKMNSLKSNHYHCDHVYAQLQVVLLFLERTNCNRIGICDQIIRKLLVTVNFSSKKRTKLKSFPDAGGYT